MIMIAYSMPELAEMLHCFPKGPLVIFDLKNGDGPRYSRLSRENSTFHRLPHSVHGTVQKSPEGELVSYIVFTKELFSRGFAVELVAC